MVSVNDFASRAARGLQDGEIVTTGAKRLRFISSRICRIRGRRGICLRNLRGRCFCSDLFHQDGELEAVIESEGELIGRARKTLVRYQAGSFANYLPYTNMTGGQLVKLGALRPALSRRCMVRAFKGDGEVRLGSFRNVSDVVGGTDSREDRQRHFGIRTLTRRARRRVGLARQGEAKIGVPSAPQTRSG